MIRDFILVPIQLNLNARHRFGEIIMGAKQIKELVFIDVETTAKEGPNTRRDAIIEIAAARVDLKSRAIVDSYEALIKPWGDQSWYSPNGPDRIWLLGEYHLNAGHFAGVDWSKAVSYLDAMLALDERFLTDGTTIAGQNPPFDLDHLRRDWAHFNWPWPNLDYHVIDLCSPALFLTMAGITGGVSLRNVIPWAYADPDRKQAHRAMGDVQDAIKVFWAMFDYFTAGTRPAFWPDSLP